MKPRPILKRQQGWMYLGAIGLGIGLGAGPRARNPLWPMLMLLLYATFAQVSLLHARQANGDRRVVAAVLIANVVLLQLMA